MKRMLRALAWIGLVSLIVLAPFAAASLTAERPDYVREHYSSWTGVLRLWKCEGWQAGSGSLTAWLNRCTERFEKKHPGVYIQMTDVSAETLKEFLSAGVNPPDLILYAPGMLEAPYDLLQLPDELQLRRAVSDIGCWQERRYAVPVALGGYAMAVNSQLLAETPENWSEAAASEIRNGKGKKTADLLNAPADGAFVSWSAAIVSMFAGSYAPNGKAQEAPVGDGIDLGLPTGRTHQTAPPDVSGEERQNNALPGILPEDFRKKESVYSQFTAGEIAAMPVTQREVRRLSQRSETGKAPDWRVEIMGMPFTDQIALVSVVACGKEDEQDRQSLCMELIQLMLTAEMQSKLTAARAFPVIDLPPLYGNQTGMREMEGALADDGLLAPPAFGNEWRIYAERLMDEARAGEETQKVYERLWNMLKGRD